MDKGGKSEPSHIPLDQILGKVREPFAIVTTEEEITTDIHGIINNAVDGLPVVSTGFITNENDVVARKRFNHFDSPAYDLLENGEAMRDVTKNRILFVTNNDNPHYNYFP